MTISFATLCDYLVARADREQGIIMASALIIIKKGHTCLRITDPLCSLVKREQILHVLNYRNTKRFVLSFHEISWVFFRDKSWGGIYLG